MTVLWLLLRLLSAHKGTWRIVAWPPSELFLTSHLRPLCPIERAQALLTCGCLMLLPRPASSSGLGETVRQLPWGWGLVEGEQILMLLLAGWPRNQEGSERLVVGRK
jgi:hypothetical protein